MKKFSDFTFLIIFNFYLKNFLMRFHGNVFVDGVF